MKKTDYLQWAARVDDLTEEQRRDIRSALDRRSEAKASVAAVDQGVGEDRRCPRCDAPGAISNGRSRGLRRYRCKACKCTFNAVTGTPLSGLHHKELWLTFGRSLAAGETVKVAAERCGISPGTAFHWRHRFLDAIKNEPEKLRGIVEADETFLLESHKGSRDLGRLPRHRGGRASKRGRSPEQVPILVATDRSGTTVSQVIPNVSAEALSASLGPVLAPDAILVTDGHAAYPPCAKALGVQHEAANLSAGQRVRGPVHIQTVNSRHSQLKAFLRPFRGVATRYLDSYLRWFHFKALGEKPTSRSCLAAALRDPPIRF